jgi:hypothetical protein
MPYVTAAQDETEYGSNSGILILWLTFSPVSEHDKHDRHRSEQEG